MMVNQGYAYISSAIGTKNASRFGLRGHSGLFRTNMTGGRFDIATKSKKKKKNTLASTYR